jgi:ubiquinone/menaquinone biosynthesis C-methylase UbiE
LPATYAISANYWPKDDFFQAESWFRKNTTSSIAEHIFKYESYAPQTYPDTGVLLLLLFLAPDIIIAIIIIIIIYLSLLSGKIMDVGCSVGASTKFLIEAFPDKTEISAVDLSPHFLSAAKFFLEDTRSPMYCDLNEKIKYHHALAEKMPFESDSYDIVSLSFLTHEIPTKTSQEIIAEAYRVLRPGGTISIVDLNGKRIKSLPQPRKYFFELTEPLIRQYYNTNHLKQLEATGFTFIESKSNDPMNTLWMASKVKTCK